MTPMKIRLGAALAAVSMLLAGCLQAPPSPTAGFALDAMPESAPALTAEAPEEEAVFEQSDLFGDEPTYVLAAAPANGASNGLGTYTRLRVMVTLDAVSFAKDPLGAKLKDVAQVVVGVKAPDYVLTQTRLSNTFDSGGRYLEVAAPVPDGNLVVVAQAIAKNGKTLATRTINLPAKSRKAFVTMSLALKFPPTPSPRPSATAKPTPCGP